MFSECVKHLFDDNMILFENDEENLYFSGFVTLKSLVAGEMKICEEQIKNLYTQPSSNSVLWLLGRITGSQVSSEW